MEGHEELHKVYEFIAIYDSLLETFFPFTILGRFGPMIWGLYEAPLKSEVRVGLLPWRKTTGNA